MMILIKVLIVQYHLINWRCWLSRNTNIDSSEYVIGKSSYFSGNGDHSFVLDDNSDNLYYAIYQKPITITYFKSIGLGQGGYGRIFYGAPTGSGNNVNSFQILHWGNQRETNQLTFITTNNAESTTDNFMDTTLISGLNTYHIAIVIEPQSTNWNLKEHTVRLYVNGVLDGTLPICGILQLQLIMILK